jgi:hypothetical protein
MSCNYYFREIPIDGAQILLKGVDELHIGQYAAGTCLLKRNAYYKTVEEMEAFYRENADRLIIVDEAERKYSWEQLKEILLSAPPRNGHRFERDEAGYAWYDEEFC